MTRKQIGIMAGAMLILGACGYLGLKLYIERDARSRLQQWVNQTGRISDLSYHSLEVGLFSKTVQISRVSLKIKDTDSPVTIDRLVLHSFDIDHETPFAMHVEMQGIHISLNNPFMKGVGPVLAQLGYAELEATMEYAYRYDPIKKDLDVQTVRVFVSDMGQLEVTARLNNIDLTSVKSVPNNPFALITLVPSIAISGITLNYQDHSMTRRLVQFGARQSGQSQEEFVSGFLHHISLAIQKQKQPASRDKLLAVQNFLADPGIIEVVISPLQPVPFMRFVMMENLDQLFDLLNITIKYQSVKQNK
jgi:hypothetical protein